SGQAAGPGNRSAGHRCRGAADLCGSWRRSCPGDDGPACHGSAVHRMIGRQAHPGTAGAGTDRRSPPCSRKEPVIKPLFIKGPSLGVRFIALTVLSIALMVVDARFEALKPVRSQLGMLLTPLYYVADLPV